MSSNQQQIIEQAKLTYCPLGKTFQKQIKTVKDQEKKQIDALADLKPKEIKPRKTKPNKYRNNSPIDFIGFKGPLHLFTSVYNGSITLEDVDENQIKLKLDLGNIK